MSSDYIKFYLGEPSSHTHTQKDERKRIIGIGIDTIRYLQFVCIGNAIKLKLSANGYRNYFRTLALGEKQLLRFNKIVKQTF